MAGDEAPYYVTRSYCDNMSSWYYVPMKKIVLIALVLLVMVGCAKTAQIVPIPDTVYDFSLTDTLNNKVQLTDLMNTNDGVVIVFFRGHF
tara:strand:- start:380 stop:649 length:270 start_codon:yes stop_codon:yes gene_type:complete